MDTLSSRVQMEKINKTASFIKRTIGKQKPKIMVVLGSGLGGLGNTVKNRHVIPFSGIPNWAKANEKGHIGQLVFGAIGKKSVVIMEGRSHYYEGFTPQEVTFPIRVLGSMGVEKLILTSATGGDARKFKTGDIAIVRDHISFFMGNSALRGPNLESFGGPFVGMDEPYSKRLIKIAQMVSKKMFDKPWPTAVHSSKIGRDYETPAELSFFFKNGVETVGMSTIFETQVAKHCGMEVAAFSIITDVLNPRKPLKGLNHDMVLAESKKAEMKLSTFLQYFIDEI